MLTEPMTALGRYIYSFVSAEDAAEIQSNGWKGLHDADIELIVEGDLAAVVSAIQDAKIKPQRKLLAAHQSVVTGIAKSWSALPVAFGLIANSESSIRSVLQKNSETLDEQLRRVQNKVEMFLSVSWTASNVFQYFVDRHPELAAARDHVLAGNASREDQIELGRIFEKLIQSEREQHSSKVVEVLTKVMVEHELQPVRTETEVFRLACLINRANEQEFNEAVYKAASQFDESFGFTFNGPWPPYSFVKLALSME